MLGERAAALLAFRRAVAAVRFISHDVSITWFLYDQLTHKIVNLFLLFPFIPLS